jgi:hypothetical protein
MHTYTVAVSGHHVHNAQYFGHYEHYIRPGPPLFRDCTVHTNHKSRRRAVTRQLTILRRTRLRSDPCLLHRRTL